MPSPKLWKKAEFNVGKMSAIGRPDGGRTRELATKIGATKKVVPKVRVELTRGCPHRFLSLVQLVLSNATRHDYVCLLQSYRL